MRLDSPYAYKLYFRHVKSILRRVYPAINGLIPKAKNNGLNGKFERILRLIEIAYIEMRPTGKKLVAIYFFVDANMFQVVFFYALRRKAFDFENRRILNANFVPVPVRNPKAGRQNEPFLFYRFHIIHS